MIKMIAGLMVGLTLLVGGCADPNAPGPTYPVVGTVSQKKMEQAADAARLTYFGLVNIAAEYASLPRCVTNMAQPAPCSAQNIVNELRRYAAAAGTATEKAQEIAQNPTKSTIPVANAVADAQRVVEAFRESLAKVRPAAKDVK